MDFDSVVEIVVMFASHHLTGHLRLNTIEKTHTGIGIKRIMQPLWQIFITTTSSSNSYEDTHCRETILLHIL